MTPDPDTLLPRLEREVRALLQTLPQCHGWDHTRRVRALARRLSDEERADRTVVECAALLHDIGRASEFESKGGNCHAEVGAAMAARLLTELGVDDEDFVAHVTACVRSHRYRRKNELVPSTLEARVVYDADKLDSSGAIGIGRAFHFAGRVGARVHNNAAEALSAGEYSLEDTAYREYLVKLRNLHDAMLTDAGRRLAVSRHAFMEAFFARLDAEVEGRDSQPSRL